MTETSKEKIIRAIECSRDDLNRALEDINANYHFNFQEVASVKRKLETSIKMLKDIKEERMFFGKDWLWCFVDWSFNKGGERRN